MATPTVYVICDQNCKFEGMTKEQILTAIMQAVNEGTIGDIDAGFVTTIKTINGLPLKFFVGEQSAYDALTDEEKNNLFAVITNDTTKAGIIEAIKTLQTELKELRESLLDGSFIVKKAYGAPNKGIVLYDDETSEGQSFFFGNTNGFGTDDPNSGYFKVWDLTDPEDGKGYCSLIPSKKGKQNLGRLDYPFNEVHAKNIFINGKKVFYPPTNTYHYLQTKGLYYIQASVDAGSFRSGCGGIVYWNGSDQIATVIDSDVTGTYSLVIKPDGAIHIYHCHQTSGDSRDDTIKYLIEAIKICEF